MIDDNILDKEIKDYKTAIGLLNKIKKNVNTVQKIMAVKILNNLEFNPNELDERYFKKIEFSIQNFFLNKKFSEFEKRFITEYEEYKKFKKDNIDLFTPKIFFIEFKSKTGILTRAIFRTTREYLKQIKTRKQQREESIEN